MKKSDVVFAELRELLKELGFQETVEKAQFVFEHPAGCTFLFRRYKDRDKVTLGDLLVVSQQLDWNGLMESADFDRLLHKTPA
jgi:hypothetical protein